MQENIAELLGNDLDFEDIDVELDEFSFDVVDEQEEDFVDVRDFVDRCFSNFNQMNGVVRKPIRKINCIKNDEPEISNEGEIAVLVNYKSSQGRGRKSVLAGQNVLHVSMPNGDFRIPVEQAEKFGLYLIGVARSANKAINKGLQQAND